MSQADTKEGIVRTLRNTREPALSAQKLADTLEVSVRTINNHVDQLVEDERIATTQIGNATAYYNPYSDLPAHRKPDHTCGRCGREVNEWFDFSRIDTNTYFTDGKREPEETDFYILCRFCYSDLINWLFNDVGSIGDYPFVHSWHIPIDQLVEVREDADIETVVGNAGDLLLGDNSAVMDLIEELVAEAEEPVHRQTVIGEAVDRFGMLELKVEKVVDDLKRRGLLFEPVDHRYKLAK